jgi:hypothetical protein
VRGSRLIPILVISSLLFTSIVYACSGLRSVEMSFASVAMDQSGMERGPCGRHHTEDICKSVRYQMLSLKASSSVPELVLHLSMVLQSAHLEIPLLVNRLPSAGPPGVFFHSVFKSSLLFSNQVLRI